jgi:hypothetical protein
MELMDHSISLAGKDLNPGSFFDLNYLELVNGGSKP